MSLAVFEALYPGIVVPQRATAWSAGYDLLACFAGGMVNLYNNNNDPYVEHPNENKALLIPPKHVALIPTGYKIRLDMGYEAQIRPRSGLALKQKLVPVNSPGTIDADFPGEWAVLLENRSDVTAVIRHGDKIAQAVIAQYHTLQFEHGKVGVSTDRSGGYGSTGK